MTDRGRHAEFTELLQRHHGRLLGYVLAMVRNFNDAQDIVQQTCLTMWGKFDEFEAGTDFGAWGCEIARRKVLNFLRTEGRRKVRFGEEFIAELASLELELGEQLEFRREALARCVEKLPDTQQQLLWRCYSGEETVKQIAAALKRTTDGIYGSLRNIRQKLAACISRTLEQRLDG